METICHVCSIVGYLGINQGTNHIPRFHPHYTIIWPRFVRSISTEEIGYAQGVDRGNRICESNWVLHVCYVKLLAKLSQMDMVPICPHYIIYHHPLYLIIMFGSLNRNADFARKEIAECPSRQTRKYPAYLAYAASGQVFAGVSCTARR